MLELDLENAGDYLKARLGDADWKVRALGGGVSNTVLLAEADGRRLVLKQALPKLRVAEEWLADRDRIQREWRALEALAPHLPTGAVPEVLFTDPENFLFAMEAAPSGAVTWKSLLLAGDADPRLGERVANMLAGIYQASWKSPIWERDFGDQHAFEQLRLDPYYEFTATRHPDLAAHFKARAGDARTRRLAAVHGDWSPKNFLVAGTRMMAIDFEVIHFGDPSFDAAFLLNHLVLKLLHRPRSADRYAAVGLRFWETLAASLPEDATWYEPATPLHLGCLLMARIDGKSPAEYITRETVKEQARHLARGLITDPPRSVPDLWQRVLQSARMPRPSAAPPPVHSLRGTPEEGR